MAVAGIFRKKEKKAAVEQPAPKTLLEELCGDDRKLYEVLSKTTLLNPEMTAREGINTYFEKAQEYEKAGDHVRARVAYQTAGEISLYEGKLTQAQKFFNKALEVDPKSPYKSVFEFYAHKENAEKALKVAREFYARTAKHAEKKES